MSKFVTLGFDREGDAQKFLNLIKSNGLLIRLYEKYKTSEGEEKARVNNIQSRSAHEWKPRDWERRAFEFAGVAIEFKDQEKAAQFLHLAMGFISGEHDEPRNYQEYDSKTQALVALLDGENIAGARLEKE